MADEQAGPIAVMRIRKIRQIVDAFDAGDTNATKALSEISDAVSGQDARVVRVGGQHTPEIQT